MLGSEALMVMSVQLEEINNPINYKYSLLIGLPPFHWQSKSFFEYITEQKNNINPPCNNKEL